MYRFLWEHKILFFRAKCSGVQLLSYMASVFLTFSETARLLFRVAVLFHVPTSNVGEISFLLLARFGVP